MFLQSFNFHFNIFILSLFLFFWLLPFYLSLTHSLFCTPIITVHSLFVIHLFIALVLCFKISCTYSHIILWSACACHVYILQRSSNKMPFGGLYRVNLCAIYEYVSVHARWFAILCLKYCSLVFFVAVIHYLWIQLNMYLNKCKCPYYITVCQNGENVNEIRIPETI